MNDDEKSDIYKMLELIEVSACLSQVEDGLLNTMIAIYSHDLDTDYAILERMEQYICNLEKKMDQLVLDLLKKNGMVTEDDI